MMLACHQLYSRQISARLVRPDEKRDTFTRLPGSINEGHREGVQMMSTFEAHLAAHRAIEEATHRDKEARAADEAAHEAQFINLSDLLTAVMARHGLALHEVRPLVFQTLKGLPSNLELFCRWRDDRDEWRDNRRWIPIPPCPIVTFYSMKEGTGALFGPIFTGPARGGTIASSDPLASALLQDLIGYGHIIASALSIPRDLAERVFDLQVQVQVQAQPQSAPTPAPIDDLPCIRRKAIARLRELKNTKGARKIVGFEFNTSERNVGRWLKEVQAEEDAVRAGNAFSAGLNQLQVS